MIPAVTGAVFISLFILQTSIFKMFGHTAPDIPLLASVYFGLRYMRYAGLQAGVVAGMVQDVSSFGLMGINLLSKGLCGLGAGWLMENHLVEWQAPVTWVMCVGFATALNQTVFAGYMASFFDAQIYFWPLAWTVVTQAFVNLLVGIPLFSMLIRIEGWLRRVLGIRQV